MVNILIGYEVIESGGPVPEGLRDIISPDIWANLRAALLDASTSANSKVCLCEICICICFAFPCIFLGHFCFASVLKESDVREKMRKLNNIYFDGNMVFSVETNRGIILNTDLINPYSVNVVYTSPVPAEVNISMPVTTYATAEYADSYNTPKEAVAVISTNQIRIDEREVYVPPAPVATNVNPKRSMKVIIPEDAVPGQQIQVNTIDNLTVMVTVPPNAVPGQQIIVEY